MLKRVPGKADTPAMKEGWGPDGQELVLRGNRLAAIRSAPWTVWAGTGLLLAQDVAWLILEPRIGSLVLLPFAFLFAAMVLAGIRVLWQIALVLAVGSIILAFAPNNPIWNPLVGAGALALLLLPSSRRYFQPGRAWLPRRLEGMSYEDWRRGALRHLKLKEKLPRYLAPRQVKAFFVGCRGRGRLSTFSHVFRREYVIAATDEGVVVARMRRPAIVSARFTGIVADLQADDPGLTWGDQAFVIAGRDYRPIRHHESSADDVVRWLQLARKNHRR